MKNYTTIVYFVQHAALKIIFTICKLMTKIDALNVKKTKVSNQGGSDV
jgi:hypothetical protein